MITEGHGFFSHGQRNTLNGCSWFSHGSSWGSSVALRMRGLLCTGPRDRWKYSGMAIGIRMQRFPPILVLSMGSQGYLRLVWKKPTSSDGDLVSCVAHLLPLTPLPRAGPSGSKNWVGKSQGRRRSRRAVGGGLQKAAGKTQPWHETVDWPLGDRQPLWSSRPTGLAQDHGNIQADSRVHSSPASRPKEVGPAQQGDWGASEVEAGRPTLGEHTGGRCCCCRRWPVHRCASLRQAADGNSRQVLPKKVTIVAEVRGRVVVARASWADILEASCQRKGKSGHWKCAHRVGGG